MSTPRRLHCHPLPAAGEVTELDAAATKHAAVLRLGVGDAAILFDGEVLKVGPVTELTNLAGDTDTLEATLELEGDAETITGVVPEHATSCDRIGDNRFRVTIPSPGQEDIDDLIDTVRKHGLSIVSINRQKLTLEEAFLRLVRGAAGGDS